MSRKNQQKGKRVILKNTSPIFKLLLSENSMRGMFAEHPSLWRAVTKLQLGSVWRQGNLWTNLHSVNGVKWRQYKFEVEQILYMYPGVVHGCPCQKQTEEIIALSSGTQVNIPDALVQMGIFFPVLLSWTKHVKVNTVQHRLKPKTEMKNSKRAHVLKQIVKLLSLKFNSDSISLN